jgi:endonuclease YncB( thermonuclease family)
MAMGAASTPAARYARRFRMAHAHAPFPAVLRFMKHTPRQVTMRRLAAAATSVCFLVTATPARAAACAFETQDEGHVAEVIDGRSFRLSDGRDIRLAGIELIGKDTGALAALLQDKDVILHGADDTPDRYGRQTAFAFLPGSDVSVQAQLLAQGAALASPDVTDKPPRCWPPRPRQGWRKGEPGPMRTS